MIRAITSADKPLFNAVVSHPLQAYEWGEFRKKTNVKVIRRGFFHGGKLSTSLQLTIHRIPKTPWTIGYFPKGDMPTKEMIAELKRIGKEENCIYIQLEPNVVRGTNQELRITELVPAAHPLFTKFTFILDLTKSEEELLKALHPKARYNIKVAQKHGVTIIEDNSDIAFAEYLRLTRETTTRQKFYAHSEQYHRQQWQALPHTISKNTLSSHLFLAKYQGEVLTAWIVFVFKDALYYPYGASSSKHRNVMHSNLMMWEVIRYGKSVGLKTFDMWGALGPNPDQQDPWYGFHSFKEKYGPEHVSFIGSYDLVIQPFLYQAFIIADRCRWLLLRLKKKYTRP